MGTGYSPDGTFWTVPNAPTAQAATAVGGFSFSANWSTTTGATNYLLDVSTASGFTSYIGGYSNRLAGTATTLSVTGLAQGTAYYYRLRAQNSGGTSTNSGAITVSTIPAAPTAQAATTIAGSSFSANWSASTGATNYLLDVSTASGFASYVGGYSNRLAGAATTLSVTGLAQGTVYYYRLRAQNSGGTSTNSGTISLTTLALPTLTAPAVASITSTGATLGATVTTNGGASLTARGTVWGTSASPTGNALAEGGTVTGAYSHARTGMTPGTLIYYRGYAINSVGTNYSADGTFWTVPLPPDGKPGSSITVSSFLANWTNSIGATNYLLDVSTSSTFAAYVSGYQNLTVGGATNRSVTGLSAGAAYYYRVRAQNSGGVSENSKTTTVWTLPVAPAILPATNVTTISFHANWLSVTGATNYRLDVTPGDSFTNYVSGYQNRSAGNVLTYPVTGLVAGTRYLYRVRAYNTGGYSGYSGTSTVWTVPEAPTAQPATAIAGTSFAANWLAATGATNYLLDVSTAPAFTNHTAGYSNRLAGTATTLSVTGLAQGTVYYYRLRAQNSGGTSTNSDAIMLTTFALPTLTTPSVSSIGPTGATLGATVSGDGGAALTARGTVWGTDASPAGNALAEGGTATGVYSHARTGMTPGTLIYYRGYAINSVGTNYSEDGNFWTVPSAPTIQAATNASETSFHANWLTATGATGYRLDVSTSDSFADFVSGFQDVDAGSATTWPVTGLVAGTPYYYRVRAVNSGGTSANSGTNAVWTLPLPPAVKPGSSITASSFLANWTNSVSATNYLLDVSTSSTFAAYVSGYQNLVVGNATNRSVTGLSTGSVYYYRVRAQNGGGVSGDSKTTTVWTIPPAPVVQAATNITAIGFYANWSASTGATGYRLDVSTSAAFTVYVSGFQNLSVGNVTTRSVTGLVAGTPYYYRVRASNSGGTSGNSQTAAVTTLTLPVLTAPTAGSITSTGATLGATVTGDGGASLTARGTVWGTSASPTENALAEGGTATGVFSHARIGMTPGTLIYYRGYAINSVGTNYSADGSFWTVPTAPTAQAATSIAGNSFEANWSTAMGATNYLLDVSTASAFTNYVAGYSGRLAGDMTTLSVTGLAQGTVYYYRLRAQNSGGISTNSGTISLTTLALPTLSAPTAASMTSTGATLGATVTVDGGETLTARGTVWGAGASPTGNALAEGGTATGVFSHARSGMTPGTLIYFRGYAVNGAGTGYSADGTFWTAPNAPTAQEATSVAGASFSANWAAATGATNYLVDVSTASGFTNYVAGYDGRVAGNVTTLPVTGLIQETVYYYRLRAQNSGGTSTNSGTISATTYAFPILTSPTASSISTTGATLGATVTSAGGTALTSRGTVWGTSANPTGNVLAAGGTATGAFSHARTGMTPGTLIYYRGYAVNSVGTGYSPDGTFWTVPSAPTAQAATNATGASFWATWSAATGATNYLLDVSTASGFTSYAGGYSNRLAGNVTTLSVTGLAQGTVYYYRLRAQNSGGTSTNSGTISLTTLALPALSSPTAASITSTGATLGATVATNGGAALTVRGTVWGTSASPTGNALAEGGTATGAYSHVRTGMTPGTLIYYRGYAANSVGTNYSADGTFWTVPNAPTAQAATSIAGVSFSANWSAATGATNYLLDVSTASGFTSYAGGYSNRLAGNVTTLSVTGLAQGTVYYYRLRAQNSGGTSTNSGTISLTTLALPALSSPTAVSITSTGATLGATVTTNGGAALTARGTMWGTGASPIGNALAEGGTATGAYSHARTGMTPGTLIYYRGYAANSVGTNYSADGTFWTVPNAPTAQAATNVSSTRFWANWTAATGATNYLADVSMASGFTSFVAGYSNRLAGNVTTLSVTGLSQGTVYYYRLRAQNSGGTSTNSGVITVSPADLIVAGRVTNSISGAGVDGVTLSFSGGEGDVESAGGGWYSNAVAWAWSGTVSLAYSQGGSFSPPGRGYTSLTSDRLAESYAWIPPDPVISGRVTNNLTGAGISGVTVSFSSGGGEAVTSSEGWYSNAVPRGWSGTAMAAHPHAGSFLPADRSYTAVTNDQPAQHYGWTPPDVSIEGQVINEDTEAGEDGVTVTFSGGLGSVTTSNGGYYGRVVGYGWTGTVTPSHSTPHGPGSMTPTNRSYSAITGTQTGQDFSWKPPYVPGTRYVSLTGLNEHPYTNWIMAARDIQTAVNASGPGDEIVVADGTYDIVAGIRVYKPITIRSVNGPLWSTVRWIGNVLKGQNSCMFLVMTNAVLDGFTIQNGRLRTDVPFQGGSKAGGVTAGNGAEIRNCIISGHNAQTLNIGGGAGGISLYNSSKAVNCIIYGNVARDTITRSGGGVRLESGSRLVNCVVYGNRITPVMGFAIGAGGVFQSGSGPVYVENCIVWGNSYGYGGPLQQSVSPNLFSENGQMYVRYCCYQNATDIQTPLASFSANPLFLDAPGGDYRVAEESWCINGGLDEYNDLAGDIAANARKIGTIDVGAYEFTGPRPRILGRVTHEDTGAGVDGVTVEFTGGVSNAVTSGGGYYSRIVESGWGGTVTPDYATGSFTQPASRVYGSVTADQREQDYVWTPPDPDVAGQITHYFTGAGLDGWAVSFPGLPSVETSGGGYYTLTVPRHYTGTATVSHALGGTYSPSERVYSDQRVPLAAENFQWIPPTRAIIGRVVNHYTGAGVESVTVSFSAGGGASVATGTEGYYTGQVYYAWSGRATPTKAGGVFSPIASRDYQNVTSDQLAQNYTWVPDNPAISGRVTNTVTGAGADGLTVSFSGLGDAITSNGGYYGFVVGYGWSGTGVASGAVGTVAPSSRGYTNLIAGVSAQDYGWTPPERTVAGRVTDVDTGAGLGGVTVAFAPTGGGVETLGSGYFTQTLYYGWSGSLTPSRAGGTFDPTNRSFTVLDHRTGEDFGYRADRTLSGRVTDLDSGAGMDGITLTLSGAAGSTVTTNGGYFDLAVTYGWSGSLTASFTNGSFNPASRVYSALATNAASQDFVWRRPRTITGRVVNQYTEGGLDGVLVSAAGAGSGVTASGGYYRLDVLYGWSGRVTPSQGNSTFTPGYRDYSNVTADFTNQDYDCAPADPRLIGRVTNRYTGAGVSGVTVTLSGGGGQTATGPGGYFTQTVFYGWSGQATPSYALGTFDPSVSGFTNVVVDQSGLAYAWTPPARWIAGVVTNEDSGVGVEGISLDFANAPAGPSVTDASGAYTQEVYYGWSGAAVATCSEGTLVPAGRTYGAVTSNLAGENYSWKPPRDISGRVTNTLTGEGVDGVWLTGTGSETNLTAGGGYYYLSVTQGWTGRVTPGFASGGFQPAYRDYSAVSEDQPDHDYGWSPAPVISGQVRHQYTDEGVAGVTISFSGGQGVAVTTNGGWYSRAVAYDWSGTATPGYTSGSFTSLPSRAYSHVIEDQAGQDYIWTPPDPVISGRVTLLDTGAGVDGAVVVFSGGAGSVTSAVGGYYSRSVPRGWSGAAVPETAAGGTFSPATSSYVNVTEDYADEDYVWTSPDVQISGRVTNSALGTGVSGATVTAMGQDSDLTVADGSYTLVVPRGWSGEVNVSYVGGVLVPSSRTYTNVSTYLSGQNYSWTPSDTTISGRITDSITGMGVDGLTVGFSGDQGESVTAGGGYYSKAVEFNWSGRVTPQSGSGTFAPAYRDYSQVRTEQAGQNYVWTPAASAGDRYVSPNGSCAYPYTNWATASTNIHWALTVANAGESVWVSNGTYGVVSPLVVNKAIWLRSANGAEATVLRRSGSNACAVVQVSNGNAKVSGFTIRDGQSAVGAGATLYAGYLFNSIVRDNAGAGVAMGASLSARMANCLVIGNTAGGIAGNGVVVNCTVATNGGSPAIQAARVYNSISDGAVSSPEIQYTLAPVVYAGSGNLTGDPLLVDPSAGDYRLQHDSPCRDAGRNFYNTLPDDLDGNPRIFSEIDMGAYETEPDTGLAVALLSDPNPLPLGEWLRFDIHVLNNGPNPAEGVAVSGVLTGIVYQSNSVGAAYNPAAGVWTVGEMAVDEQRQLRVWGLAQREGYVTNVVRVTASQADPGEPGYDVATNVTRMLGEVSITNVAAASSSGNATVEWESVVGLGYNVYSCDGAYVQSLTWTARATLVASEDIPHYMDPAAAPQSVSRRYYQVTFSGHTPTETNAWALIRRDVRPASFTLLSPPVRTDRRFDGRMGAKLAEPLTGHDGGVGSGADEVYILQTNGQWRVLYLDGQKLWRESNGNASDCELAAGQGFWVCRRNGTAVRATFTGPVGNDGTQTGRLAVGWTILGLSEGKDLPPKETFAAASPVGAPQEEDADLLVLQNPDGTWRRLMYVQGWGAPYDGNWFDLSTFRIYTNRLEPGAAYYYFRQAAGGNAELRF
ncbi:MAG: fibronectin type III domain-containing protein [Kiritimatiellae bacterium]|nr:fibronectin type III domain-containing protein [Kiritimatiellia bacterium]